MLVLNFTHPLTTEQCAQIEALAQETIAEVRTIYVQVNHTEPLGPQITGIINNVGLSCEEWQTQPLLINPPGYAQAAFVLLAEIHGRIGHFPTVVRLRPKFGPITTYEVVELLNLQTVREASRVFRDKAARSFQASTA
ncbi:MAG: hypothetical protein JO011_17730 [Ktedonobacteraceae bacterium]|nr:hypothetical protein [Ktedonobacteraceae bacterium]